MAKNRNLNSFNTYFDVIGFLYKFMEGNLMTNLVIELLLLSVVLVNFGDILTAKIYSQPVKEIQRKRLFCSESISNPYCVF